MPFACDIRKLDEGRFYSLFCEDFFSTLSRDQKIELLQEAHNREAARMGIKPVPIKGENMRSGDLGGYFPGYNYIGLNLELLDSKRTVFETTGVSLLSTVLHEGRHAFQTAMLQHPEKMDKRTFFRWAMAEAKYFITDSVHGKDVMNKSWALYAMQPIETDARRYERRRIEQISEIVAKVKGEPDDYFLEQIDQNLNADKYAIEFMSEYWTKEELLAKEEEVRIACDSKKFRDRFPNIPTDLVIHYFYDALLAVDEARKGTKPDQIIVEMDMHADAEQGKLNGFVDEWNRNPDRPGYSFRV